MKIYKIKRTIIIFLLYFTKFFIAITKINFFALVLIIITKQKAAYNKPQLSLQFFKDEN